LIGKGKVESLLLCLLLLKLEMVLLLLVLQVLRMVRLSLGRIDKGSQWRMRRSEYPTIDRKWARRGGSR
jgi:hypothetical protein